MDKKIATYGDLDNIAGFDLTPDDNALECVTREMVEARLKPTHILGLDGYANNELVALEDINPYFDYSYFRVSMVLPTTSSMKIYACGRGISQFTGTSVDSFSTWLASGQKLNASKYSPDGAKCDIKLFDGKWSSSPYNADGGYLYLVLYSEGIYYLYGGKTLRDILGVSGFGALDESEYFPDDRFFGTYSIGGYIRTLTGPVPV